MRAVEVVSAADACDLIRLEASRFDGIIHNFMQQSGISAASDRAFRIVCAEMRLALG